jgi:hypothetical protein
MDLDSAVHSSPAYDLGQKKQKELDLKNHACFKCHAVGHQIRGCPKNSKSENVKSH